MVGWMVPYSQYNFFTFFYPLDVESVGVGFIIRIVSGEWRVESGEWIALKCIFNFRTNTFGNFNPEECESDY